MTMTETVPFSKLSDEWKADPAFVAEYERIVSLRRRTSGRR